MKTAVRVPLTAVALIFTSAAQHSGDAPPALVWNQLKGVCPQSLDWAGLRGKVVVLSFVGDLVFPNDIADWNDVPKKFQPDRAVFIRVAGGSEFLLDQALRKRAYQGCVLFDRDGANRRDFGLPAFPRTVVVNQLGYIAGYDRGDADEDAIRSVLNYRGNAGLAETPPQPKPYLPAPPDELPSYEVHISAAPTGELPAPDLGGPDRYITRNQPLENLIVDLWATPRARISFPLNLDEGRYDVTAHLPAKNRDALLNLVREELVGYFGLSIERETRWQKIYVLTAAGKTSPQLQPAQSGERWMTGAGVGSIAGTAQSVESIASGIEGLVDAPVIDETGIKGKYDYSASSDLSGPEAGIDIARQLGLDLAPADRPIEMLVVQKLR